MKSTITIILLFMWLNTFSQHSITGNISSEGTPLIGANIIIKHTNKGTISDFDGNFEIDITPKDTLVISYLGYDSKEIAVENHKKLEISLDGNIALDEVKIVAYGTTRKTHCGTVCCSFTTDCFISSESEDSNKIKRFKSDIITEKLYPNPSKTGRFQLKLVDDYKNVELEVFNISGQLVKTNIVNSFNKNLSLDLSEFSSGIYIVNIIANGKNTATKKAIID